jgi:pimeloyl-ACP methyl ester carboxylesterase
MMKYIIIFGILLISSLAFSQDNKNFVPSFKESAETTHKIPKDQKYTFGYLEVLENRSDPNSQTIKIPVYIFKSRSSHPEPDPIIYTVGGPGSTTMPSAQYMEYYQYLDDRDFILFEQRGNYYAVPHLDCPEWKHAVYQSNLPGFRERKSDSLFVKAANACKERLMGQGIDLNGYNTNEIAADVADLRKVLGIDSFNLLTISYSTKIAQVLLRDYPGGIRSVVMDSPLPLEVSYDEESVGNLLTSVEKLLSDCEADVICNRSFPNLKHRFFNYLSDKTQNPLEVTIENPLNGNPETFKLRGKELITVFTSAATGSVSDVPFEINKLLNDDLSSIKEQLASLYQKPNGGAGIGMRLSVWCAEEYPFNNQGVIKKETSRYPEVAGLSPAVFDSTICNIWGVAKVPDIENQAVKSDIPVLLINGEYDNETPPGWADKMRKNLNNSYHLVFKGWKHTPTTNWGNQCAMKAANDFFNNPNQAPMPACFKKITTPGFKIE